MTVALKGGSVAVEVPATSANLGPAYDCAGLALDWFDRLQASVDGGGVNGPGAKVVVRGEGEGVVPADETNLVYRALAEGLAAAGLTAEVQLECDNNIPHGRGLGSSSAAIVGGLVLARELLEDGAGILPDDRLLEIASRIEGHPDNVAPALLGGLTIAWNEGDVAKAFRAEPHPDLSLVVAVPDQPLATERARELIPAQVPHADAAFNAGRSALLIEAITRDTDLLMAATEDRLHQDYRSGAYPASVELVARLRSERIPAVISGAGPTVLALMGGIGESDLRGAVELMITGDPAWRTVRSVSINSSGARRV